MTNIDTDAIRSAWRSYDNYVPTPWETVADMCDEIDNLREELRASERWRRDIAAERDFEVGRRKNAEAAIAALLVKEES